MHARLPQKQTMQNIIMMTVENSFDWFRNYLSGRQQIVKFKLTSSDYLTIKCGVPQGSMIYVKALKYYPLFYLLMIQIPFLSHRHLKALNNTMNQESEKVTLWLAANKLSLNV